MCFICYPAQSLSFIIICFYLKNAKKCPKERLLIFLTLGSYTNDTLGMIETLFAQCICGIIWGLFSAQPLLIGLPLSVPCIRLLLLLLVCATGPVLIFEASLYKVCCTFLSIKMKARNCAKI